MNARFWEPIHEGWVKITLRPGQTLQHRTYQDTDEGWHACLSTWRHDGNKVFREIINDGRDCDGRLTRTYQTEADIHELSVIPCFIGFDQKGRSIYSPIMLRPDWQQIHVSQYDEFAQAAGY